MLLKLVVRYCFAASIVFVGTLDFELWEEVSNHFVWLWFEIKQAFASCRTHSGQVNLQLKTAQTEAIFALAAFNWAHQDALAEAANQFLRERVLVHHSLGYNRVLLFGYDQLILTACWLINDRICEVFRNQRKVDSWVIINVNQSVSHHLRELPARSIRASGQKWRVYSLLGQY